jgi:hypothetical protein
MCLVGDKMPCQTNYLWTRRIFNLPPTSHTRYNNKELIRSLLEMLVKENGQTSYQRKQEQVIWGRPISYEYTFNITFKSLSKLGFLRLLARSWKWNIQSGITFPIWISKTLVMTNIWKLKWQFNFQPSKHPT